MEADRISIEMDSDISDIYFSIFFQFPSLRKWMKQNNRVKEDYQVAQSIQKDPGRLISRGRSSDLMKINADKYTEMCLFHNVLLVQ
jgi:hypothetical protein